MINPLFPHICAKVKLLTTERGGRDAAIPEGEYQGIISARGQHFSFRCEMPDAGLELGRTIRLDIEFLFPHLAVPFFKDRLEFNIWEGGTVGYGRVVKVYSAD